MEEDYDDQLIGGDKTDAANRWRKYSSSHSPWESPIVIISSHAEAIDNGYQLCYAVLKTAD